MRKALRTAVAAIAMCSVSANAWAQSGCAAPQELAAIKTAAIQQELMVAALSCNATPRYNQFVTTFQRALQDSDRNLRRYFQRTEGRGATAAYHAFKTRLANAASRKSIAHITNFCNAAEANFQTALDAGSVTLAGFVSTQPPLESANYSVCENMPIMARAAAEPPAIVSVPQPKPTLVVAPAVGLTLRGGLDLTAVSF